MVLKSVPTDRLDEAFQLLAESFKLTKREEELLQAIYLHGFSNKELADYFCISEKTVKNHIANLTRKTNTNSTRKLVSLVARASIAVDMHGDQESKHAGRKGGKIDDNHSMERLYS